MQSLLTEKKDYERLKEKIMYSLSWVRITKNIYYVVLVVSVVIINDYLKSRIVYGPRQDSCSVYVRVKFLKNLSKLYIFYKTCMCVFSHVKYRNVII